MGDEQDRAGKRLERGLERLAALEVEMVRRLVEDEKVRSRGDDQRERQPTAFAARELVDALLVLVPAGEEEAAEQRLRLRPLQAGGAHRALEHAAALVELDLVLGEVRELDAVADPADLAGRRSPSSSVDLPEPFGPISATCSPRSSTSSASSSSGFVPAARSKPSASITIRPLRTGFRNSKPSVRRPARGALDALGLDRGAICFSFACACRDFVP